jgi:endonuclease/exonuclease/phosphatase family metal-dependent hydrolase
MKYIVIISLLIGFFATSGALAGSSTVKIASWNLKHLGRKSMDVKAVAKLLTDVDIVTFQEVNISKSGKKSLWLLRDLLAAHYKESICSALSEVPSESRERYAYLWRNSKISYVKTNGKRIENCPKTALTIRLGNKFAKEIRREPSFGTFYSKTIKKNFVLASIHLRPTAKKPEREVGPLFMSFEGVKGPVLIAGDFNLDSVHPSFEIASKQGFRATFRKEATSLKMKSRVMNKPYDNIWYRDAEVTQGTVKNLYEALPNLEQRYIYNKVSDHSPIYIHASF